MALNFMISEATVRAPSGLNDDGPHRPMKRDNIRRRGLVGIGEALLEEVCVTGVGL